jgi:hypothetical protein
MRSAWGVDTLTLATTDSDARRTGAGAGMQGRGTQRLPDTDAAKEWAPARRACSVARLCCSLAFFVSRARRLGSIRPYPIRCTVFKSLGNYKRTLVLCVITNNRNNKTQEVKNYFLRISSLQENFLHDIWNAGLNLIESFEIPMEWFTP